MATVPKKRVNIADRDGAKGAGPVAIAERFRRTRRDHASEIAEDYVELIDDLIGERGEARLVDIARRMGVSHVTVSRTLGRLQRDGLIDKRPYRAVFLTDDGRKLAEESRRRHRIILDFLCAIGVPPNQAALDAEGIEHHIAPATLKAISRFLRSTKGSDSFNSPCGNPPERL